MSGMASCNGVIIMGAMSSAVWWPEDFCCQLADPGRYVIRYDHRDTGRSTCYAPGTAASPVEDLADDAVRVLCGHGADSGHFVGMSLDGLLAQLVALKDPERVRSLTLIASGPLAATDPGMPSMDPAILAHHQRASDLDWTDREAVVAYQIGAWRLLSGSRTSSMKRALGNSPLPTSTIRRVRRACSIMPRGRAEKGGSAGSRGSRS